MLPTTDGARECHPLPRCWAHPALLLSRSFMSAIPRCFLLTSTHPIQLSPNARDLLQTT
jgi:hypothetical protein